MRSGVLSESGLLRLQDPVSQQLGHWLSLRLHVSEYVILAKLYESEVTSHSITTARTASKFCARTRSNGTEMLCLILKCRSFPEV